MERGRHIESQTQPNHGEDKEEQDWEHQSRFQDFRATLPLESCGSVRNKGAVPLVLWLRLASVLNSALHGHQSRFCIIASALIRSLLP
jgi:hypothetical protein